MWFGALFPLSRFWYHHGKSKEFQMFKWFGHNSQMIKAKEEEIRPDSTWMCILRNSTRHTTLQDILSNNFDLVFSSWEYAEENGWCSFLAAYLSLSIFSYWRSTSKNND